MCAGVCVCVCVCVRASQIVSVPEQWLSLERQASWQETPVMSQPHTKMLSYLIDTYSTAICICVFVCVSKQYT